MKTLLKIVGIIVIILFALAIILPFIFKGEIVKVAKDEMNKSINATVDFESISLSVFKSFPNFNLGITNLAISGKQNFEGDTLAYLRSIDVSIDLMSVISGSEYIIKKIQVTSPDMYVKVLENGSANYDIAFDTGETATEKETTDDSSSAFSLQIRQFIISDANLIYEDQATGMKISLMGLDHNLSGDFTADMTDLDTKTSIDEFTLNYDGIEYFKNTAVTYNAIIQADLLNEIYTLKKNDLSLNNLQLQFDGSVSMVKDDINLVLTFNTPKTEFKEVLSLVPAIYMKEFESVQTSGEMSVSGHVKGIYNENNLPAFDVRLEVNDAMFKYPDLPESVENINILTSITNKGGTADNTVVDISQLHIEMGNNPVDIKLLIKTPVSDPELNGNIKGKLDLSGVKNYYPLEPDETLTGIFLMDLTLAGKLSSIENEEYERFTAIGSLLINNFEYVSTYTGDPIEISNAQLNFSPQYLDLVDLKLKIGKNDLTAKGKVENYLAFALKDEMLKGSLTTRSTFFDLNSFVPEDETEEEEVVITAADESSAMEVIEVPGNIDFDLSSSFDKLIYDNMEMTNAGGKIRIADSRVSFENLGMNILEGEMTLNGEYNTIDPKAPEIDFRLNINDIDIQKAYNTFGILSKYAPIAKKTDGKFSTSMTLKSALDEEMMPVYESMTGGGEFSTTRVTVKDVNTLNKIAEVLKYDEIKRMVIDKILFQFEFIDGKILIEPFDIKQKDFTAQVGGWTGFDQSIEYVMNLNIPRNKMGNQANDVLNNLVKQANDKGANFSLGETVSLDLTIGGTLTDPKIKTDLRETGKNIVEDVKKQVEEEIQKKKEELSKEARAKAQKILDDANKQANNIVNEAKKQANMIRKNAAVAADKIIDEADKNAKKIENEGKKKGFLAEAAAKESAKQIRNEAKRQAQNVKDEADKQANNVVNTAQQQAKKIRQDAQKRADKVLEDI